MGSTKIQTEKSRNSGLEAQLKALQKYVPSVVWEAIARDPQRPALKRHMRELTVLFMDIAGCTRLCERCEKSSPASPVRYTVGQAHSSSVEMRSYGTSIR